MKKSLFIIGAVFALAGCSKTVYQVAPTTTAPEDETTIAPTTTEAFVPTTSDYYSYYSPVEEQFLAGVYDLYPGTIYVADQDLIDTGYSFCEALRSGMSAEEASSMILSAAGGDADSIQFLSAVDAAAVVSLCPDQMYKWEAYM
jgi:hypothetical protein